MKLIRDDSSIAARGLYTLPLPSSLNSIQYPCVRGHTHCEQNKDLTVDSVSILKVSGLLFSAPKVQGFGWQEEVAERQIYLCRCRTLEYNKLTYWYVCIHLVQQKVKGYLSRIKAVL